MKVSARGKFYSNAAERQGELSAQEDFYDRVVKMLGKGKPR